MKMTKTVGILGGMGPLATAEFFRRLVVATPADVDQEHLHILIDNDPRLPDRTEALLRGGPSPVEGLVTMARRLERAGADFIAIPCNTAHAFLEDIRAAVSIPVLDMVEEAVRTIGRSSVGLLATEGTISTGLYQRACAKRGIRVVVPEDGGQRAVADAIAGIKGGRAPRRVGEMLGPVLLWLRERGAEAVIAACTEISLVPGGVMSIPWIDAMDRLVEAALREAGVPTQREVDKEGA